MNKKQSLALYAKGKDAWNVWANDILAKKVELEQNKQWQINTSKEEINQATKDWIEDSSVDFSEHIFKENVNFSNFIFPHFVSFNKTTFSGHTWFENVVFNGDVGFYNTTLDGDAGFHSAEFNGDAWFDNATFRGDMWFNNVTFRGIARFNQILCEGSASFQKTQFEKEIFFIAMRGQRFFSFKAASFYFTPDFNQAHFTEAPQLDDTDFSKALNHNQSEKKDDLSSCWRSLKRLAIQGHDHERELIFFAEEIKSQRGIQDRAFPNLENFLNKKPVWSGCTRYWFGYFYQYLSNFGRSVMRPLLWWLILNTIFYIFYLEYPVEDKSTLTHDDPIVQCNRSEAAIYLSARSALPFLPTTTYSENINRSYTCLYGRNSDGKANIPNTTVLISIIQTILSTILIFLSLLALRNYFRIK